MVGDVLVGISSGGESGLGGRGTVDVKWFHERLLAREQERTIPHKPT